MAKFPHYLQLGEMDCGPTALRIVAKYYGKYYSSNTIQDRCHLSHGGVSLLGISEAAESIGFRSIGVKISWRQLRDEANLPCIAYLNQEHFVVVYKIKKYRSTWNVYVSDPACGLLNYDYEDFLDLWIQSDCVLTNEQDLKYGLCLILEPTPKFYKEANEENNKYNLIHIIKYIRPFTKYLLHLFIAIFSGATLGMLLPFITQAIVDRAIGVRSITYVVLLLIAQLLLVIGQLSNNMIRSWLMLHLTTRVSISLISDFLFKLMKLPIAFFDSRMTGDIIQRIDDYNKIQKFLTGTLLSVIMAIIVLLVYSVIMAFYDWVILIVFLGGSIIYVVWVLLFMKHRRKLDYMRFQYASDNHSNVFQLVNGMQDIKLHNCERQKRWEWERIQANLFNISVKSLSLSQSQEIGGAFIDQIKNIIISFVSAVSVISGDMTIGMMMAVQYIIGQLNAPISQFIQFIQAAQDAKIATERIGEIHEKADEEPENEYKIKHIPDDSNIIFKDVVFQYNGPHSAKVLNNINLTIPSNKVTAIVGASGSGKTTLLKLILGFYEPTSGNILLDNILLKRYSVSLWRKSCGVVMQEGCIFSDTIAGNIAVSDEVQDMTRIEQASKIANIETWINELPFGYNTKIGIGGNGLSSGQKQRLLIARAAYKNAKYLLLDEATNSLDANNERSIMDNLQDFFKEKTVIVVAHRLSTVKSADNIVVLNDGCVVECGTHKALLNLRGYYYNLVKNQLELGE